AAEAVHLERQLAGLGGRAAGGERENEHLCDGSRHEGPGRLRAALNPRIKLCEGLRPTFRKTSTRRVSVPTRGRYRIQSVAEMTGVSAATLRAWERRYGVPTPRRSHAAYRLYSDQDVAIIRRVREL